MKLTIIIILCVVLVFAAIIAGLEGDPISLVIIILGVPFAAYMIADYTQPTIEDVYNGKAETIETVHITNGDTIKTYRIEWKGGCK